MISVFTPTNNTKHLNDCYTSLLKQSFTEWEWVVLYNGADPLPFDDPRVKTFTGSARGVGDAKAQAVDHCTGDLLVELDHDDMLAPDCLQALENRFYGDGVLFYSDFRQINEDGSPNHDRFLNEHGWEYYDRGVCRSMSPSPHNVSLIWYAPNHVRAFTRAAYNQAGGYNRDLLICDDQDLMARLYQIGEFVHIPECLYYQRVHPNQAQKIHNAEIQTRTLELYDQYIEDNALAWARREGLNCLELGAAHNASTKPDYICIDKVWGEDVFAYLKERDDSSVGVIRAVDFLEHIPDKIALFNEFHRVLAHGGLLLSLTPSTDGRGAFQDPTHVAFYNSNSFWYYTDREYTKYVPLITARFQVSRLDNIFPSDFHKLHNIPYVQANLIALHDGPVQGGIRW